MTLVLDMVEEDLPESVAFSPTIFKGTTLHIPSFKMLQLEDSWWIPGTEGVLIPLAQSKCRAYIPWAVVCSSFRPHCARRYSSYDPGILVHIHPIRVSAFQIRFSRPMGCKVRGVCYNLNISPPDVNQILANQHLDGPSRNGMASKENNKQRVRSWCSGQLGK